MADPGREKREGIRQEQCPLDSALAGRGADQQAKGGQRVSAAR
jgi:hypothetical protein